MDNLNLDALSVLGEVMEGDYAEGQYGEGEEGEGFYVIAQYAYESYKEGDLPLQAGDEVYVTQKTDEEWWYGSKNVGENTMEGYFPANYCTIKSTPEIGQKSDKKAKEKSGWRLERDNLKQSIQEKNNKIASLQSFLEAKKKEKEQKENEFLSMKYRIDETAFRYDLIRLQLGIMLELKSNSLIAEKDQKLGNQIKLVQDMLTKEKDKAADPAKAELTKMLNLMGNKLTEDLISISTLTNSSDQFLNVLGKLKDGFEEKIQF